MEIRNRLFPYPVLCGETDDYIEDTEFAIAPRLRETTHELILDYDFILKCESLENLLRRGDASYVLHIECSVTSFRIPLKSDVPHIEYRIPKSRVSGEISLVAMIVAKKDIGQYTSTVLNEDYDGEIVSFKKGSILAYQNLPPIYVSKKKEELANNDSFFTVIKKASLNPEEIRPLEFNLFNDKMQIFVDEKTYEAFVRYQHTKSIAMSLLVFPTLIYMINEVKDNPDSYAGYLWFQRLAKFYRSQKQDFVNDILREDENPVIIAQEMIQNPISRAYRELYSLEGDA